MTGKCGFVIGQTIKLTDREAMESDASRFSMLQGRKAVMSAYKKGEPANVSESPKISKIGNCETSKFVELSAQIIQLRSARSRYCLLATVLYLAARKCLSKIA